MLAHPNRSNLRKSGLSKSGHHSKHDEEEHHEIVQHPNLESSEQSSDEPEVPPGTVVSTDFAHSKFVKWFSNFDERVIKPFLIHNYSEELIHVMHHMHDLFNHDIDFHASDHEDAMDDLHDKVNAAREAHTKFKEAARKREA